VIAAAHPGRLVARIAMAVVAACGGYMGIVTPGWRVFNG